MNEIKVGDLVQIVRVHCGDIGLGEIYCVEVIRESIFGNCVGCGASIEGLCAGGGPYLAPLSWLRRIPPMSELESTEHKEETPA